MRQAEEIVIEHPGIASVFSFAGSGGLNQNTAGASTPKDTIGQIQLETIPWEDRRGREDLDGNVVIEELTASSNKFPVFKLKSWPLAVDQPVANQCIFG